jgi:hypothetical protein
MMVVISGALRPLSSRFIPGFAAAYGEAQCSFEHDLIDSIDREAMHRSPAERTNQSSPSPTRKTSFPAAFPADPRADAGLVLGDTRTISGKVRSVRERSSSKA